MRKNLADKSREGRRESKVGFFLLLLAVFSLVLVITEMTPLVADDYDYAFSWSYFIRIDNLKLLRGSMNTHRLFTHGRVFAQGWVCLFLMLGVPEWAFSIANALVCTAFAGFSHAFFQRQRISQPAIASAALGMLLWICMPVFGQVFLWLDGACNYFWGAALCWAVLEQAFRMEDDGTRIRDLRTILLLPFAFVAGAWSEHISFAMLVILFLYMLHTRFREKRIPFRATAIWLLGATGYLYLMFQPTMLPGKLLNRADGVFSSYLEKVCAQAPKLILAFMVLAAICTLVAYAFRVFEQKNGRQKTVTGCFGILFGITACTAAAFGVRAFLQGGLLALVSSAPAGISIVAALFFFALWNAIRQNLDRDKLALPLILTAGGVSALIPFLAASYKPARGFCAPVVFTLLGTVLLLGLTAEGQAKIEQPFEENGQNVQNREASITIHQSEAKNRKTERAKKMPVPKKWRILMTLLAVCFLFYFTVGFSDIARVNEAAREREQAIAQALEGDGILVTRPYPCRTKYSAQYGLQDLEPDGSWPNDKMKAFYGLKDIIVEIP